MLSLIIRLSKINKVHQNYLDINVKLNIPILSYSYNHDITCPTRVTMQKHL